jgi:hypothetical protein
VPEVPSEAGPYCAIDWLKEKGGVWMEGQFVYPASLVYELARLEEAANSYEEYRVRCQNEALLS